MLEVVVPVALRTPRNLKFRVKSWFVANESPESSTGAVPLIVTSPVPWKAAYGEFWSIEPLKNPLPNDPMVSGFDPTARGFYNGGDLKGIINRLDYIKALGTTAIWLTITTPASSSSDRGSGVAVRDAGSARPWPRSPEQTHGYGHFIMFLVHPPLQ